MSDRQWNILEKPNSYYYIKDDDICIYAREYVTGYGYQAGATNQLILNFKKKPSTKRKKPSEWKYRTNAIETFVKEWLYWKDSRSFLGKSSINIVYLGKQYENLL